MKRKRRLRNKHFMVQYQRGGKKSAIQTWLWGLNILSLRMVFFETVWKFLDLFQLSKNGMLGCFAFYNFEMISGFTSQLVQSGMAVSSMVARRLFELVFCSLDWSERLKGVKLLIFGLGIPLLPKIRFGFGLLLGIGEFQFENWLIFKDFAVRAIGFRPVKFVYGRVQFDSLRIFFLLDKVLFCFLVSNLFKSLFLCHAAFFVVRSFFLGERLGWLANRNFKIK